MPSTSVDEHTGLLQDGARVYSSDGSYRMELDMCSRDDFLGALDRELGRVTATYTRKETQLYGQLEALDLESNASTHPTQGVMKNTTYPDDGGPVDRRRYEYLQIMAQLLELQTFVSLHMMAFEAILTTYDRRAGSDLKASYMTHALAQTYPFRETTQQQLRTQIQKVKHVCALDTHLTLPVTAADLTLSMGMVDAAATENDRTERVDHLPVANIASQKAGVVQPRSWRSSCCPVNGLSRAVATRLVLFMCSLVVFLLLLQLDMFHSEEQNRCFALLVFCSLLWATEAQPLFVTAMLVPFLSITLGVMRSDEDHHHRRLGAPEAARKVFASMFSPVIMLLLGGFAIASALTKYGVAQAMATAVLSKAGTQPKWVLLANMLVATMASMCVSNVAASVLCFSLIQPLLRALPAASSFGPCLVLGIALASNLGGMASPIASPQNIVTIQNMPSPPSWGVWFAVTLPLCLVGNLILWRWLLWSFVGNQTIEIRSVPSKRVPVSGKQLIVVLVTLVTILLWCLAHTFATVLGDMGVIAIVPLVVFFGTGLLTKDDFNQFSWTVVMLAMGGIALGKAVQSSGLLLTMATAIQRLVEGCSVITVLLIFGTLMLMVATFISHTVAALILLPIVAQAGAQLPDPRPELLVMGTGLVCSVAMGLPVSGFPNMNAISLENAHGKPYLTTKDFLRNGVPASLLLLICVVTLGYSLMSWVGL